MYRVDMVNKDGEVAEIIEGTCIVDICVNITNVLKAYGLENSEIEHDGENSFIREENSNGQGKIYFIKKK